MGRRRRRGAAALALVSMFAAASVAYAGGSSARVPLRPVISGRTALVTTDKVDPALVAAPGPSDGSALAAWTFSTSSTSPSSVQATILDRLGRRAGAAFSVDTSPPPIPGYHFSGHEGPLVSYSPSADAWIVVVQANYGSDQTCARQLRGRRIVGSCRQLYRELSVRVDPTGRTGPPTTVLQASTPTIFSPQDPPVYGPFALSCRTGGCLIVAHECLDPTVYQCDFNKKVHEFVVALDANGSPLSQRRTAIDTGHRARCPNDIRGEVFPPSGGQASIASTNGGYLVSWATALGGFNSCVMLRSVSPAGAPSGPLTVVNRDPPGRHGLTAHNPRYNFELGPPHVCSYQRGARALVTWFVMGTAQLPPSAAAFAIGIYRQSYGSDGRLTGRDTRAARSIAGYDTTGYAHAFVTETLAAAPGQNRCVVLATGINKVDAFAYDPTGRIRQHSEFLRYHRPTTGALHPPDEPTAVFSNTGGILFDVRISVRSTLEAIDAYPLR